MIELLFLAAGIGAILGLSDSKDDRRRNDRASDNLSRFKLTGGTGIHSSSNLEGYWKPHLTGTLDDEPVHIPYRGQTTLGMFDKSLGVPTVSKMYELHRDFPSVFKGSGLDFSEPYLSPQSRRSPTSGAFDVNMFLQAQRRKEEEERRALLVSPIRKSSDFHWSPASTPSTGDPYQNHWLGVTEPVRSWPAPTWNKECYEGTSTLKPVAFNPVYENALRDSSPVYFAHRPDVQMYTGQTDIMTWGKSLPAW
jgi:hypothetical protein